MKSNFSFFKNPAWLTVLNLFLLAEFSFSQTDPPITQWQLSMSSNTHDPSTYNSEDWFYAGIQTSDGGYLGAGYSTQSNGTRQVTAVKYDAYGNLLWEKLVDGGLPNTWGVASSVLEVSDGYIVVGQKDKTQTGNDYNHCSFFVKLSKSSGTIMIGPIYYGEGTLSNLPSTTGTSGLPSITLVSGGQSGFIIRTSLVDNTITAFNSQGAAIIRIDNSGNLINTFGYGIGAGHGYGVYGNSFNNGRNSSAGAGIPTYNSSGNLDGFVLVGSDYSGNNNNADGYVVKTDNNGVKTTDRFLSEGTFPYLDGGNDPSPCDPGGNETENNSLSDVRQLSNGGDLIIASTFDIDKNKPNCTQYIDEYLELDAGLFQLDYTTLNLSLNSIFRAKKIAHFTGIDYFVNVLPQSDGGYILTGSDYNITTGTRMRMIKTDASAIIKWDRIFPGQSYENCGFGYYPTIDKGLVVFGNDDYNGEDYWISKISSDLLLNQTYDYVGSDPNAPTYTVTGSETWSADKKLKQKVIIANGGTLTVQNCTIQFADSRQMLDYNNFGGTSEALISNNRAPIGITVQSGGQLIVDGSTLRGMQSVGGTDWMWDGITVEGKPKTNQTTNSQGVLQLINTAIIKDARVGATIDVTSFISNVKQTGAYNVTNSGIYTSPYTPAGNKGGGWVSATSATFKNNDQDVYFSKYKFFDVNTGQYKNNKSKFTSTVFYCDAVLVDPNYLVNGLRVGTSIFTNLQDVHGVTFANCTWQNSISTSMLPLSFSHNYRGIGINGTDADFNIQLKNTAGNNFQSLTYGIYATASSNNALVFGLNIDNSTFNFDAAGIFLSGIKTPNSVTNCYFTLPDLYQTYGLYLLQSTQFTVQQNTFTPVNSGQYTYGIFFSNCGSDDNLIKRNTFNNLTEPTTTYLSNASTDQTTGLQLLCSTYNNCSNDVRVTGEAGNMGKIRGLQGQCVALDVTKPANNEFNNSCSGGGTCHIQVGSNALGCTYDYPQSNSVNGYTYQPIYYSSSINPINCNIPGQFTYDAACPSTLSPQANRSYTSNKQAVLLIQKKISELKKLLTERIPDSTNVQEQIDDLETQQYQLVLSTENAYLVDSNVLGNTVFLVGVNENPMAVPYVTDEGKYDSARSILDTLPIVTQSDQDFHTLMNMAIDLDEQDTSWLGITPQQDSIIQSIASDSSSEYQYQAKNIEKMIHGTIYHETFPPPENDENRMEQQAFNNANVSYGIVYPNPSLGNLSIEIHGDIAPVCHIINIEGQIISALVLKTGTNEIQLSSVSNGMYFLKLRFGNISEENYKIILSK